MKKLNHITRYHEYALDHPRRFPKTIKQRIELEKRFLKEYTYHDELVDSCIRYIETYCLLVDGQNSGSQFKMTLTQKWIIAGIFGFWGEYETDEINANGEVVGVTTSYERVTKEAFIMVASGFGKTTFVAAICELILTGEGLFNDPKIFIGSIAHAISRLCFDTTSKMIKKNSRIASQFNFRASSSEIEHKHNGGLLRAMSSLGDNHEGIVPAVIILDEIHAMKTGEYANNLKKSTKRDDMLVFEITTQGTVRGGYLDNKLEAARLVLKGDIINDRNAIYIYENESIEEVLKAYEKKDLDILFKSNPNIGISQSAASLYAKIKHMIDVPKDRVVTLTKNFNIPQNKEVSFYSRDACITNAFDEALLYGKACFIGLDMAYTTSYTNDLTALTFVVHNPNTNEYFHKDYLFLPKYYKDDTQNTYEMIPDKTKYDGIEYERFIERGDVILVDQTFDSQGRLLTDGTSITEEYIINFILSVIGKYNFNILKFGVDPNKASKIINHFNSITGDSKFCLNFLAERKVWTNPIIENNEHVRRQKLVYDNNKLTENHFANTMSKVDNNGYITLINEGANRKDMVIAHLAAYSAVNVWSGQMTDGISNEALLKQSFGMESGVI